MDKDSLAKRKDKLLEIVNATTGRDFRVLPATGVKKLLDNFTLEEIEASLKLLRQDPWHSDKIKDLSVDYLIRATTIDRFLQKAHKVAQENILNDEPLITL